MRIAETVSPPGPCIHACGTICGVHTAPPHTPKRSATPSCPLWFDLPATQHRPQPSVQHNIRARFFLDPTSDLLRHVRLLFSVRSRIIRDRTNTRKESKRNNEKGGQFVGLPPPPTRTRLGHTRTSRLHPRSSARRRRFRQQQWLTPNHLVG
eukprot:3941827-Rhodomonas_salina.1